MSGTPASLAFVAALLLLLLRPACGDTPAEAGPVSSSAAAGHSAAGQDTLVGEVVDIQCFARAEQAAGVASPEAGAGSGASASSSGVPAGWNECGVSAVKRGAPVGVRLRDGSILLAAMHDRNPAGRALARFLGMEVRLVGHRLSQGGIDLLEITRILGRDELRASREEGP